MAVEGLSAGPVASVRNYSYDVAAWHEATMDAINKFRSAVEAELDSFD
jgi:hypothetical protein